MIFRLLSQFTSLGEATNSLIDAPLENTAIHGFKIFAITNQTSYLVRLITPISQFINTLANRTFIAFREGDILKD